MNELAELEILGLDHTALDVYRALLEHPDADDRALSESLRLEPNTLRETKQRLRDLQLLVPTWAVPDSEHAVQPSAGLDALLQRRRAALTRQQEALRRTEVAASVVAAQLSEQLITRDGAEVEVLRGRAHASSRIAEIAAAAEQSCWGMIPADFSERNPMSPLDDAPDRPQLERGIEHKAIYLTSAATKKSAVELFEWYRGFGGEVRVTPTLPLRLMIFDQKLAVAPLDPDDPVDAAVVHRNPSVVRLAVEVFRSYWSNAADVFAGGATVQTETLTPQEAELVRLLADGATDEQVARRFGVSIRTIRRIASDLSKRTGARSRFELGVRAAQRGWIT